MISHWKNKRLLLGAAAGSAGSCSHHQCSHHHSCITSLQIRAALQVTRTCKTMAMPSSGGKCLLQPPNPLCHPWPPPSPAAAPMARTVTCPFQVAPCSFDVQLVRTRLERAQQLRASAARPLGSLDSLGWGRHTLLNLPTSCCQFRCTAMIKVKCLDSAKSVATATQDTHRLEPESARS